MSLETLVDNTKTDKNTIHSYLPLYQKILETRKKTATNVLEVGICHGGSIKLWNDFFTNATVYGIDILEIDTVWDEIKNNDKIILHTSTDGYDYEFIKSQFIDKNIKFDVMLDDGPHTIGSMILFIHFYSKLMADDGILIIEDVQSMDWCTILLQQVPEHLRRYVIIYDLRKCKNRYDDIVFTIDKKSPYNTYQLFITA